MEPLHVGLAAFGGVVLFAALMRLGVRFVDRRRIRELARYRGWTNVVVRRGPEDRWGLFRRGDRGYEVRCFDEFGVSRSLQCRVSAGTVLWPD